MLTKRAREHISDAVKEVFISANETFILTVDVEKITINEKNH